MTGSPLALGLNLVAFTLPRSAVRLYAGVYVDRWDRRRVMMGTEVVRGVLFGVIGLMDLYGPLSISAIYLVSFSVGLLGALFELANEAILPVLVKGDSLVAANSVFTATFQFENIIGPALAGVAIFLLGTGIPILIDSASFFILVVALALLPMPPAAAKRESGRSWSADFREGLEFFRQRQELVWLAAIVAVVNFSLAPFWNIYLLVFAKDYLLIGSYGWGLLSSASAGGILAGSLLVGRSRRVERRRLTITASLVLLAAALLGFALTMTLPLSVLAVFAVGLAIPFSDIMIVTLYQQRVPNELMGRVSGVRFFLAYMLIPVSVLFGGFAVASYGARASIFISGVMILVMALGSSLSRSLRRIDESTVEGSSLRS